jgi:hypothetical protein
MSGIEDHFSKILALFIATGENNRIGPFTSTPRNACDTETVYAGFRKFCP